MIIKKGFTILEMLIILALLGIVIFMSRSLFTDPNKDIINSEICINKVSGELEKFLYNGITGKKYDQNNSTPDSYTITILQTTYGERNQITLSTSGSDGSQITVNDRWGSGFPSAISQFNCNPQNYVVILSGGVAGSLPTEYYFITINKNLQTSNESPGGFSICRGSYPCSGSNRLSTYKLEYWVCTKRNNQVDMSSCVHTYTNRFDTTTQSMKSNKCLGINRDTNICNQWSIDNF
ncbi:hypothetical protein XF24_00053 [candidate division SR1 bacterium Aalborg_AAW-1]|nr:hypothetical protein XF24_00053 [candidate division SR1 bacterium Aalborg_AAW-1]